MKNQASNIKTLLKSSLSYLTIVVPTGVILTGGACGSKNKTQLKRNDNQKSNSFEPTNLKVEAIPSVSDHTRQVEQAYKEVEKYLDQSKQALADAKASTTQSALEKFKQSVKDAAEKAAQAAEKAEAAAQTADDNKAHDVQQASEYAKAARIAAEDAKKNAKEVEAIQLGCYYYTHYPEKPNQAVQVANTTTNPKPKGPIKGSKSLNVKLNGLLDKITQQLTDAVVDNEQNLDAFKEKIAKLENLREKINKIKTKVTSRKRKDITEKELLDLEKQTETVTQELQDLSGDTKPKPSIEPNPDHQHERKQKKKKEQKKIKR